jgi:urease accessory protein
MRACISAAAGAEIFLVLMNFLVWQLIDSSFPSGGFAHSAGLEACVQHGHVVDGEGVRAFARHALVQCGRTALPLVSAAHGGPDSLKELDHLSDVFLWNPVANRASRAQGRALLTSVSRSFHHSDIGALEAHIRAEGMAGHLAPLFGRVFRMLDIDIADTQRAFLFIAARGVSSAAVRLGIMGAYEAQTMQMELASHIGTIMRDCGALGPHDIAQTAPLIDLFQATHDRLYSRLFQS